jgi:hypothetical protein
MNSRLERRGNVLLNIRCPVHCPVAPLVLRLAIQAGLGAVTAHGPPTAAGGPYS